MLQHFGTGLVALLPLLEDQLCRKLHLARDVVARARHRTEIGVPERLFGTTKFGAFVTLPTSARNWSFVASRRLNSLNSLARTEDGTSGEPHGISLLNGLTCGM
jgi:hypothetical protein